MPKSLAARVGGMCGWPTFHFWTTERLRAGLWAREGRWYYVEGERQLISAAGSPPTLLPCQAGHLSVTGGAQVLRGLASGTGVPAHPARWYSSARLVCSLVLGALPTAASRLEVRSVHADAPVTPEISCRGDL
ncbi:Cytochrome P450 family protein [Aspergillus niger]|uniref:Cytochrome P450 family protein n=1 Tax=Aspergillus niger TaxID=5061 RepID=A0A505I979_ASPNG|nr:Cytochrome P450 family protein [Aspergillus niger]